MSHSIRVGSGPVRAETWAKSAQTGFGDGIVVRIDQQRSTVFVHVRIVARKVDFADPFQREGVEIGPRIVVQVDCRDMHIVDVEQQAAARARSDLAQELGLRHRAAGKLQVVGRVFQQDAAAEAGLHFVDMPAHPPQRRLVIGHGQQVVEISGSVAGPGEVFGNARGFQPGDEARKALQMSGVERPFGADRKADAMAGNREPLRDAPQPGKLRAAVHHVVFRMDFEPGNRAGRREDVFEMPGLVADAGSRRQTAALLGHAIHRDSSSCREGGLSASRMGPGRGLHRPQPGRSRSSASGEPLRSPGISMATQVPRGTSDQALPW